MKITAIKDYPTSIAGSDLMSSPSYDLTVEMSQEEYNHICYLLEKDVREAREIVESYRRVKEIKTR